MSRPSPRRRAALDGRSRSLRGFLPSVQALEGRTLLATVIDNGGPGFTQTPAADWTLYTGQNDGNPAYGGSISYAAAGDGSAKSDWGFAGLAPGRYLVSASYSANPNRATDAPYSIDDGSSYITGVAVNQRQVPVGSADTSSGSWIDLGTFEVDSGTLKVELSNLADGYVVADAVRVEMVAAIPGPPAAPTGLATTSGPGRIDLSWAASAGATGYSVERSADGVTGWAAIGSPTSAAYADAGLAAGDTYSYRVRASGASGFSAYSAPASGIAGAGTALPVVSIEASQPNASEAEDIPGVFQVTRNGSTASALSLTYTVYGSNAFAGYDYVALPGVVVIPAGQSSVVIQVTPIDHDRPNGLDVSVVANLVSNSTVAIQGSGSASVSLSTISPSTSPKHPTTFGVGLYNEDIITKTSPNGTLLSTHILYQSDWVSPQWWPLPISWGGLVQGQNGTATEVSSSTVSQPDIYEDGSGVVNSTIINYGLKYTPELNFHQGSDSISFSVYWQGLTYPGGRSWLIYDNTPPSIADPGDQNGTEGDFPDLTLNATDPNNNLLTYSATNLPPGLSIDPIYGNITGSIDYNDATSSPYEVTVTATNDDLSSSQTFLWNVAPAAPSIDNSDDPAWDNLNNAEGEAVSIPVVASDPDNRPLNFSATGLPAGLMIDAASGIISGTIAAGDDTGTPYDVTVSVSNGYQATTLEFPWTVTLDSLVVPADQTNTVGDAVSLPIQAGGPTGSTLVYSADGLPDGLSINPSTGVISGTPASADADGSTWQVTIDVSDGTETAEHYFNWTILPTSLPVISVVNPGNQVNYTDDVISLPILGNATGVDNLSYSATGLPDGLSIDPESGVITGMDDDFAHSDSAMTYTVTVAIADDYGQTASQTFNWEFDPNLGGGPVNPFVAPGQHPQTESRTDRFDVNAFWSNVEKLPGGLAAENWFASKNGQVNWGWTLSFTHGRWEKQADGSFAPVVHIPWQNNEADAATKFVNCVNQDWFFGFAEYSLIPTDGNPVSWQTYIKARTKAQGQVAVAGAELYLSGLSIVNEGIDFAVTLKDIAGAESVSDAAIASISILPFITSGTIKLYRAGTKIIDFGPT